MNPPGHRVLLTRWQWAIVVGGPWAVFLMCLYLLVFSSDLSEGAGLWFNMPMWFANAIYSTWLYRKHGRDRPGPQPMGEVRWVSDANERFRKKHGYEE